MAFSLPHDPLCFMVLLLLPFSITAQNITLGSSLKANRDNSSWLSPSGDFAFGFQQIGAGGNYILAIWFNKIPQKTITWSAKGDNLAILAPQGSKIELTTAGNFVLSDPKGQQIWAPNYFSSGAGVSYAAMLDTGNFVLETNDSSSSSSPLWQSFDEPTDTILPTQTLKQGSRLVARYSETNYSSGRFLFTLQSDGNLVLYTTNFPLYSGNFAYWATKTVGSGFQVLFNQSGFVYLIARNGTVLVSQIFSNFSPVTSSQFYQRVILEQDGVLRQYIYPKSGSGRALEWSVLSFEPSNICLRITQDTGSGACGINSYCKIGSDDQRPKCECPEGYSFFDPSDESRGCKTNFIPQSCDDQESNRNDLFRLVEMPNTDWPLSDYEHYHPVTEDWCREVCLNDCSCAVAIFRDGDCWKKRNPLSNGRFDASVGGKALIKVRKDNSAPIIPRGPGKKNNRGTLVLAGSVLLGSSLFVNFLLIGAFCLGFFLIYRKKSIRTQNGDSSKDPNLRCFTYKELEEVTNGFKEELGRGGCGIVYKGVMQIGATNVVAVKKLDRVAQEREKEFKTEVNVIGRTHHKNLVRLLGFCNEGQHRMLVYEFLSNGTLATFLFGESKPSWNRRTEIALGIARGLLYLHEECSTQIIHCDIKPQNILLDDHYNARISDFGLAKLMMIDQSKTISTARGTKGYVAPEWFNNKPITAKVDIYSFGVLLLEIITCRKNVADMDNGAEEQAILTYWASDCYQDGKLDALVENDMEALNDWMKLERFLMVAIWCIQDDPSLRPTMRKVNQMLEGVVEVARPPCPSQFSFTI